MSKRADQLVEAVTAWAEVSGDCDTPEWRRWHHAWRTSSDADRRAALVSMALRLVQRAEVAS